MKKDTYTIRDAFVKAVNQEADELPDTDTFPSSLKFVKRITALFKKEDSPLINLSGKIARRVAVAVTCVVTVAALTVGVGATILHFGGFKTHIHDKGTRWSISDDQWASMKDFIEEYYTLGAIPENFELTYSSNIFSVTTRLIWEDGTGKVIEFKQTAGKEQRGTLNTEDYPYEELIFNGHEAIYFEWRNTKTIMWIEDGYKFMVGVTNFTREDLFRFAESLTKDSSQE